MFSFTSLSDYQDQLQNGRTTCLQAVRHFLSAIEEAKHLNCFAEVYADEALARAAELDAQPQRGLLHGVVIGLKDNICYKGHRVSAASAILQNFTSLYSATAVERLIAGGAIIIGRQNCDEFGMGSTNENSVYGSVSNPVNTAYVAGGSSGGSAAAVKAGLCMASLGSDTGGSVRLPASFCGVVGYKPAYGRVSRHGLIAYASSFDVIGVLANSMDDAATIANVISGPDEYDSTAIQETTPEATEKSTYKIAYFPQWVAHPSIDNEVTTAFEKQIENLRTQGHTVEPIDFMLTDAIVPTYYVLTTAEASANLSRYDGVRYGVTKPAPNTDLAGFYSANRSHGFGAEVKKRILLGTFVLSSGYYDAYYTKAQQVRGRLVSETALIFNDFDLIIAPVSPSVAYKKQANNQDLIAIYMGDIFTVFANLCGLPAISLPLFQHSSNLPFGFQVMSAPHNEVYLHRFPHLLMQQ